MVAVSARLITVAFVCVISEADVFPIGNDTSAGVSQDEVRSLAVRNPDDFMSPPVIRIDSDDRIVVNFDIISESHRYLRYRLVHCNSDWLPSRFIDTEYLSGFNEGEVEDYAYSSNTYVHYVNYNIEIPSKDMKPLMSGNYLLQVYEEGDPGDMVLQQRFYVTENSVELSGCVSGKTDIGFNTEYQQLEIYVDAGSLKGMNPYQDLVVTVMQNNRPETERVVPHPLRVEGDKVVYAHDTSLIFKAGDEYRRFETVRADYAGMHADSVKFIDGGWHAYLTPDEPRLEKDHVFDSTQHGRFKVDEYNSSDPDLGADYVTVHFNLDVPEIAGADIYVDGDFTLHKFGDHNRMEYDRDLCRYTLRMPLKQGSYNYQYVVMSKEGGYPDTSVIDGNKYETRNEYLVNVYYRPPASRGDRLVASKVLVME